jgi:hypothetical protein
MPSKSSFQDRSFYFRRALIFLFSTLLVGFRKSAHTIDHFLPTAKASDLFSLMVAAIVAACLFLEWIFGTAVCSGGEVREVLQWATCFVIGR